MCESTEGSLNCKLSGTMDCTRGPQLVCNGADDFAEEDDEHTTVVLDKSKSPVMTPTHKSLKSSIEILPGSDGCTSPSPWRRTRLVFLVAAADGSSRMPVGRKTV